jgi:hypothetical protein
LEKFPEIINTRGHDQQAAKRVGHALERSGGLDQEEIDERDYRVGDEKAEHNLLSLFAMNDLA